jgi:hypothetical protein
MQSFFSPLAVTAYLPVAPDVYMYPRFTFEKKNRR